MRFFVCLVLLVLAALPSFADVETVFTPEHSGLNHYLQYLENHCHKSLFVCDYAFTSPEIADEYCKLAKEGKVVRVILDKRMSKLKNAKPLIKQLRNAGIEVTLTNSPVRSKYMHCKFSVLDEKFIEDGSWNYTPDADNQVNNLNFETSPNPVRAKVFLDLWNSLFARANTRNSNP